MSVTIYSFSRWRHNPIKVLLLTSQTKLTLNLNLNLTLLNPSVFTAADDKQVTVLIGLDLSAAFNMVNHDTLLQHLDRIRSDRNGAVVALVLSQRPVTVCKAWQPPVTTHQQSASTLAFLKDPYWDLSCLLSTAVQWVTS